MRTANPTEIKDLRQFKEYLNKLDETKPIVFKTIDGKELEFYGVNYGGVVIGSNENSYTIAQGLIFQLK